mgnify:FL=1
MIVNINVPDTLAEITLDQYQRYLTRTKGIKGDDLAALTVSIFCNVDIESVRHIKLSDVREISEHLNMLFSVEQSLVETFKIEGVEFGFINELESMTFGEYVDLDKYVNDWESMHRAMAVIYRPVKSKVKDKYIISEYQGSAEFAEVMKLMTMDKVLGSMVFFYDLGRELLRALAQYSLKETRELATAPRLSSIVDGDGITQFMLLLEETLADLMKPLKPNSLKL